MAEDQGPEGAEEAVEGAPGEVGGASRVGPAAGPIARPQEPGKKKVQEQREGTRTWVAYFLLSIFAALLLGGAAAAFYGGDAWLNYDNFLRFTLPAVTGLLGTAFGSQR